MSREILHSAVGKEGLHVVLEDRTGGWRWGREGGDLRIAQRAGEDEDLVDVSGEITRDSPNDTLRGCPDRCNRTRRILGNEDAVHVESHEARSKDRRRVVPIPVIVRERAYDFRKHIGTDGLVERGAEASVRHQ